MIKFGIVTLTGKPNVGKSTLINAIAKREVAITSHKPQTTRNKINYIYTDQKYCISFIDTPGFHFQHNKLDDFINKQIWDAYKLSKIIFYIVDSTKEINEEDLEIINNLKSSEKTVFTLINKIDITNEKDIAKITTKVKSYLPKAKIIYISALEKKNINQLLDSIDPFLDSNQLSLSNTDNDNFIISEIIRQQIILNSYQELPYATAVTIKHKKYDKKTNTFSIFADIVVEKSSQKPIIIGKNGTKIKTIRIESIKKLNKIYDCKINLHLFVVVYENWRNDDHYLKEIGYK